MRSLIILFLLTFFVGLANTGVLISYTNANLSDISSEQKSKILDNFKESQKENIFGNGIEIDEENLDVLKQLGKIDAYNVIKEKAEKDRKEVENKYKDINKKRLTLSEVINELDESIISKKDDIDNLDSKIEEYSKNIEENKQEIKEVEAQIEKNRQILSEYLVKIYKNQTLLYEKDKIDNIKAIALGGGNIGDILVDYNFDIMIELTGEKLVENHREYVKNLYVLKSELAKKINDSKKTKIKSEIIKKLLEEKIALKQDILEKTEGNEYIYKKYLAKKIEEEKIAKVNYLKEKISLNDSKEELFEKYGCKDFSENEKCKDIEKMISLESRLASRSNEFSLIWPVNPEYGISAYYNDSGYYDEFKSSHDAIDIIEPQGTEVVAPEDGYVIYVNEPKLGNYSYVAIKHSNDIITVYGHLSKVEIKKYDYIKKGEVFAYTGGEVGTSGAGIMTTGPHLHFEIINGTENIDPLNYLDLTVLDLNSLPIDRYFYKYYDDFKSRYGESEEIEDKLTFRLKGDTEIERQKNAVLKYGVNGFGEWDMWVEEGVEAKIDPSFLICIGIAETGLGKRLKTKNNVGNIGNTDSGSTYQFDTPRIGIYRMARTLNNPYLGGYNELRQLSRYGNKDGSIYASDNKHWHNNIVKCMSEIKGTYIKDDYKFRLDTDDMTEYELSLK